MRARTAVTPTETAVATADTQVGSRARENPAKEHMLWIVGFSEVMTFGYHFGL